MKEGGLERTEEGGGSAWREVGRAFGILYRRWGGVSRGTGIVFFICGCNQIFGK